MAKTVLYIEVSLFRSVLIEGFHCIHVWSNKKAFSNLSNRQHGISDYLQLVRSRYQPPSLMEGKGPSFDLPALQKDILVAHLAGRSIIMNPSTIRTVFKFKEKRRPLHNPTEYVCVMYCTCCHCNVGYFIILAA